MSWVTNEHLLLWALAQNAPEDLILELSQGHGILLGGNQSTPVVGHEFSLAQPIGVVKSENHVVWIASRGQWINAHEPYAPRPEIGRGFEIVANEIGVLACRLDNRHVRKG